MCCVLLFSQSLHLGVSGLGVPKFVDELESIHLQCLDSDWYNATLVYSEILWEASYKIFE